jgi:phenylpyruvate tautomerase PptA (4-oxalocrotonate tautomerase family)
MPYISVQTNIEPATDLVDKLSALAAGLTGKDVDYVMARVDQAPMTFGGTEEPCAFVEFASLGLDETKTAQYAAAICGLLETDADIPPARIYIHFQSPERTMFGWNSKTFA